jgi:hypothetical protein
MSNTASGADTVRPFNPQTETHYAISQDVEFELRELFLAIGYIGDLSDGQPGDQLADLNPEHFGCIFRTFSRHGHRLLAEKSCVHANRFERKAA